MREREPLNFALDLLWCPPLVGDGHILGWNSRLEKDMRLPRQKKLYKRGILMEDDFVAVDLGEFQPREYRKTADRRPTSASGRPNHSTPTDRGLIL
jgi:hypothetical protein